MTKVLLCLAALFGLSLPAAAQETRIRFAFQDASVDAVLRYVSRVTGWVFVLEAAPRDTITAYSDADLPATRCLDFLNASLRRQDLVVLNPAAPGLPGPGDILRVVDLTKAQRAPSGVSVGLDPRDIPLSAVPRTQILPLQSARAAETAKDFGDVFRRLLGDGSQVAVSSFSNSILVSGSSEGVHRVAEILSAIDRTASVQLRLAVFPLQYTDAAEAAKTLNDVFKREAAKADSAAAPRIPAFFRALDPGTPATTSPAHEIVRVTPDPRSNSLIAGASEENLAVVRMLLEQLDRPSAAMNTYVHPLTNLDAAATAAMLNSLWRNPSTATGGSRSGAPRSDGTLSPGQTPFGGSAPSAAPRGTNRR